MQSHFDRVRLRAEQFRDLGDGLFFQMKQHNHLTVPRREILHRLAHAGGCFVLHRPPIRCRLVAPREPSQFQQPPAAMRAAAVQRDRRQPRDDLGIAAEAVELFEGRQKDVLHDILGAREVPPAEKPVRQPPQSRRMQRDKLLECGVLWRTSGIGDGANRFQPLDR